MCQKLHISDIVNYRYFYLWAGGINVLKLLAHFMLLVSLVQLIDGRYIE